MKPSIAIALIICGTALVTAPYVHRTIAMDQVAETMIKMGKPVNLSADLPDHADLACMAGGFAMILGGAGASLFAGKND